jgi:hypothetical protein
MSVVFPKPIADYFAAENGRDVEAMAGVLQKTPSSEMKVVPPKARPRSSDGRRKRRKNTSIPSSLSPSFARAGKRSLPAGSPESFPAA